MFPTLLRLVLLFRLQIQLEPPGSRDPKGQLETSHLIFFGDLPQSYRNVSSSMRPNKTSHDAAPKMSLLLKLKLSP